MVILIKVKDKVMSEHISMSNKRILYLIEKLFCDLCVPQVVQLQWKDNLV